MASNLTRACTDSTLGDSWMVASSHSSREQQEQDSTAGEETEAPATASSNPTRQMNSSHPSISGPELIMPSIIYDTPLSGASSIAPNIWPGKYQTTRSLQRRTKKPSGESTINAGSMSDFKAEAKTAMAVQTETASCRGPRVSLTRWVDILRWSLNFVLVTLIMHLLVLPEWTYHSPAVCSIPGVSRLHPSSCASYQPRPESTDNLHRKAATETGTFGKRQTLLHGLLNTSMQELGILGQHFQQIEHQLRQAQTELKARHPSGKHELDLEFHGYWQAFRTAKREYESLKADMRSALDSLVAATRNSQNRKSESLSVPAARTQESRRRTATQVSYYREQSLDRLIDTIQSKAASLSNHLSVMGDHLEFMSAFERRNLRETPIRDNKQLGAFLFYLASNLLGAFRLHVRPVFNVGSDESTSGVRDLSHKLDETVQRHRILVRILGDLTQRSQRLQQDKLR